MRQFLHACVQDGVCVASASPALHMHDHDINLRIELASVVDGFLPIVQACHVLEGDGFLAPITYDKLVESSCTLKLYNGLMFADWQHCLLLMMRLNNKTHCFNMLSSVSILDLPTSKTASSVEFNTRGDLKEAMDFFKSARHSIPPDSMQCIQCIRTYCLTNSSN